MTTWCVGSSSVFYNLWFNFSTEFHYSEQCRPEYSDNIMDCYDDHIKKTRLKFHDENDFILNTSNQLRDTCLYV